MDVFTPITNAECVLPPKKNNAVAAQQEQAGGRRKTRRVKKAKHRTYRKRR